MRCLVGERAYRRVRIAGCVDTIEQQLVSRRDLIEHERTIGQRLTGQLTATPTVARLLWI
jgi:hypothetical protein